MKKFPLLLALVCIHLIAFSQKNESVEKINFGFGLGTNYSMLHAMIQKFPAYKEQNTGVGFVSSLIMDYNFSRRFTLSPKAELAFHKAKVFDTEKTSSYSVFPATVDLMCHVYFNLTQGINSWYLVAGPGYRVPLQGEKFITANRFKNHPDVFLDFGFGLKHKYNLFKFSPELRYSLGLANVNSNATIPAFSFNKISLMFYFK